jgi:predicted site-specific integrase-resolvase
MNIGQTNKVTILYERLSQEDSRQDMSLSIENQMQILETYAKQNGSRLLANRIIPRDVQGARSYANSGER